LLCDVDVGISSFRRLGFLTCWTWLFWTIVINFLSWDRKYFFFLKIDSFSYIFYILDLQEWYSHLITNLLVICNFPLLRQNTYWEFCSFFLWAVDD
jgi:hypothetical protein